MKKNIIFILLILFLSLSLFAGGGKEKSSNTYTVGICNYVDDASLNQICDSIKLRLEEIEKERNVKFNIKYDNANADSILLNQIISTFVSERVDLIVAVATPVALAASSYTEDVNIPVVFSAVTDPLSVSLVNTLDKPGKNVTGTSDALDTSSLFSLLFKLLPDVKKVGLLYDIGQDSSTTAIKEAKSILEDRGVKYVEKTGTNTEEVILAVDSLINEKVEAIFTPTDNTIMTAELSIYEKLRDRGIPHFAGADSFALNGAFLGYGVDYVLLGRETANMVSKVLLDKESPSTLPVAFFDNGKATINQDTALSLSYDLSALEKMFTPLCSEVKFIETKEEF